MMEEFDMGVKMLLDIGYNSQQYSIQYRRNTCLEES